METTKKNTAQPRTNRKDVFLKYAKEAGFNFILDNIQDISAYLPKPIHAFIGKEHNRTPYSVLWRRVVTVLLVYQFKDVNKTAEFLDQNHSTISFSLKIFNDDVDTRRRVPVYKSELLTEVERIVKLLNKDFPRKDFREEEEINYMKMYFDYGVKHGYITRGDAAHLELKYRNK
jgi:hypothetical protein